MGTCMGHGWENSHQSHTNRDYGTCLVSYWALFVFTQTMPIQTPHNYQIPQMNHGYSPIHVPYTSPRTAPMSYSFQTSFPLDRSSPQQDPLFNASKSYFGDSSPPSYSRDQSFAPGERRQSSVSSRDPSFSDMIATDGFVCLFVCLFVFLFVYLLFCPIARENHQSTHYRLTQVI